MLCFLLKNARIIHRHIGGLEMSNTHTFDLSTLHRHIGGLETMSA